MHTTYKILEVLYLVWAQKRGGVKLALLNFYSPRKPLANSVYTHTQQQVTHIINVYSIE